MPAIMIASSAVSRSVNVMPASVGGGMPINPLEPPVRPRHSMERCCTMNAKAMVIIARYGPVTRNAGSDSNRPIAPAKTPASGSAIQNEMPFSVRIATV